MNRGRPGGPVEGSKRFYWPVLRSRESSGGRGGLKSPSSKRPTGDQARETRDDERRRVGMNERKKKRSRRNRCDRRTRIGFRQQLVARNSTSAMEAKAMPGRQRSRGKFREVINLHWIYNDANEDSVVDPYRMSVINFRSYCDSLGSRWFSLSDCCAAKLVQHVPLSSRLRLVSQ